MSVVFPQQSRRIAVWLHTARPHSEQTAAAVCRKLAHHGLQLLAPEEDWVSLQSLIPEIPVARLSDQLVELGLIFGGDGSILRAAEWAHPRQVPLLGINFGHVGFLAELDDKDWHTVADAVVHKKYVIQPRQTLQVMAKNSTGIFWKSAAVNEVSLEKVSRQRMLQVEVDIDKVPLSHWGCDGVLVATPTGSTAYAFSVGGPVVWPNVEAFVVLPVSAHALFNRPVVVGPDSVVTLKVTQRPGVDAVLWCDGRRSTELPSGTVVEARMGELPLLLAKVTNETFTSRLQRKFGLQVEGFRGCGNEQLQPHNVGATC